MTVMEDSAPLVQPTAWARILEPWRTATHSLGYCHKYLEIPQLPDSVPELEQYLMLLYNVMDQAWRARELAKRKLEAVRAGEGERME